MIDVNYQEQSCFRGEAVIIPFSPESATDITGWTLTAAVSTKPGATVLLTLTPALVSAPAGTFTVTLTAAQTTALNAGAVYHIDVWRINAGYETRLAGVLLRIVEPVRRPA